MTEDEAAVEDVSRDADGMPLHKGDTVLYRGEQWMIMAPPDGKARLLRRTDGGALCGCGAKCSELTLLDQAFVAADGKPVVFGETVWHDGAAYEVREFDRPRRFVSCWSDATRSYRLFYAEELTHVAPDLRPEPDDDPVNHPSHYTSGDIECIDAIRSALGPTEFRGFLRGNVMKYVWRCEGKGGVQDMRKAEWYMARLIAESGGEDDRR